MDFITIARLLFKLFPLIVEAVKAAESAFPDQGSGAAKLGTVVSVLEAANDAAPGIAENFDQIRAPAEKMIGGIVQVLHKTGVFAPRPGGQHP